MRSGRSSGESRTIPTVKVTRSDLSSHSFRILRKRRLENRYFRVKASAELGGIAREEGKISEDVEPERWEWLEEGSRGLRNILSKFESYFVY